VAPGMIQRPIRCPIRHPETEPMDHDRIIELLEPLLTSRRLERMGQVLDSRSDQAAFVFEAMTDPHNLSAALRSLDAFSFQDAWLISPGERLGLSRGITIGSERWLTLHRPPGVAECFAELRGRGYAIYASHLGEGETVGLHELDFSRRTALVFGNEHAGVSGEVLELADASFRIEMHGFVESLNLSVAVAVSAHHARTELNRLEDRAGSPGLYALAPERRRELYAHWLRGSVRRAEKILAEAGIK